MPEIVLLLPELTFCNVSRAFVNFIAIIFRYSRGIIFLEDYPSANEVDNKARDDEISILCSNKAQSLIKMNAPERACVACRLGLRCANNISRPKLLIRFI